MSARNSYHHGELRAVLIRVADDIIREGGIEGFSLREAARRAGVTPGAPAHHFGSVAGLLTEVAVLAYEELGRKLAGVALTGVPVRDLHALTTAYIMYALEHSGRFRLMCRKDLVDRHAPHYQQATLAAMFSFAETAAAYYGTQLPASGEEDVHPGVLMVFASAHGIASWAIEDKWDFALRGEDREADFLQRLLPSLLLAQWPT